MTSEKITIYRTNENETQVIEQYPKTISTQVYDVNGNQFLNETVTQISNKIDILTDETNLSISNISDDVDALDTVVTAHLAQTTKHKYLNSSKEQNATGNAEGQETSAKGSYSHAEGFGTTSSGIYSHAEGENTIASGFVTHAEGFNTTASGSYSHAEGRSTTANVFASHAMGQFNNPLTGGEGVFVSTADAFVIGNGSDADVLSNAFRVRFNGASYGLSAFNSAGADYAEYFEWLDCNFFKEDRVGYFVTLSGDKIRKSNSSDNYILGVISANPSIIGDSWQDQWNKRDVTDEWGRPQYHYVDVEYANIDENGKEITKNRQDYVPIYNDEYDNSIEYISREDRPEWDAVGMMGKLLVREDGTCEVNGYCKSNDDGIATSSIDGYRVMKRVSDNIVQVLIK